MEVAPRLKNIEKRVDPVRSEPKVRFEDEKEKTEKLEIEKPLDKAERPEKPETSGFFSSTIVLILIFATVIVILIVVVVWLMGRNDRYTSWMRGTPPAPPVQPKRTSHADLVKDAAIDELAMYANLGAEPKKENEKNEKPEKPEPPNAETIEKSDKPEKMEKTEKPQETKETKEKKETKETREHELKDDDSRMEEDLDAQLNALAAATDDDTSPSAISDEIDKEVAKMDANQQRAIEQVSTKTNTVVKVYTDHDGIVQDKYDLDSVIQCCQGKKPKHKGFVWRYRDDTA